MNMPSSERRSSILDEKATTRTTSFFFQHNHFRDSASELREPITEKNNKVPNGPTAVGGRQFRSSTACSWKEGPWHLSDRRCLFWTIFALLISRIGPRCQHWKSIQGVHSEHEHPCGISSQHLHFLFIFCPASRWEVPHEAGASAFMLNPLCLHQWIL